MGSPPTLAGLRAPPDLVAWLSSRDPASLDPRSIDCPRGDWSVYLAVAAGIDMRTIVRATCGVLRDALHGHETQPPLDRVLDVAVGWSRGLPQQELSDLADEVTEAIEVLGSDSDMSGQDSANMRVLGAMESVLEAIAFIDAMAEYPPGGDLERAACSNATNTLAGAMYSAAVAPIEGDRVSIAYDEDGDTLDPDRFATTMRTLAVLFRAELATVTTPAAT